jgi:hypothetical protein
MRSLPQILFWKTLINYSDTPPAYRHVSGKAEKKTGIKEA